MELNLILEDAVSNPVKFTYDGVPSNERANFDQRRYANTKNARVEEGKQYEQKFESADQIRIQFFSNFPLNRVKIIDCEEQTVGAILFPTIAVQYRNKFWRSSCKFASINDKLFIYFGQTQTYSDEALTVPVDLIDLQGRLPNINAVPGDVVRYTLDGVEFNSTTIAAIVWNPTLLAEGYLTEVDFTLVTPVDGKVEISYDEKPADLYSQLITLDTLPPGKYFLRREHGITSYAYSFTSEPLDVRASHPETLALIYRHNGTYNRADLWNYVYLDDWTNTVRIPSDFYRFTPAGELEADVDDSGEPRILRAVPYRQLEISFFHMPAWLADKVQMALSHDVKTINGYYWEVENFGAFEMLDSIDLGTYTVNLRQKNDRTKKVDNFTIDLTASFTPPAHGGITFAGTTVASIFNTNSGAVFHFVALPSWITCDRDTFINGDTLVFTIAPNASAFERSAVLQAVTTLDGLIAEISLTQNFDTTVPEFLDATPLTLGLSYPAGSNDIVSVNASGPYSISYGGAFTFSAAIESGGTVVRVTAPSLNNTGAVRTGTVTLTLNSNPTKTKTINVSQVAEEGLITVSPSFLTFPSNGGTQNVLVHAATSAQWQASTNQPTYVIVTSAIQTGPLTFTIFLNGRDLSTPAPRFALVTLTNINNPSNVLNINIQQN